MDDPISSETWLTIKSLRLEPIFNVIASRLNRVEGELRQLQKELGREPMPYLNVWTQEDTNE